MKLAIAVEISISFRAAFLRLYLVFISAFDRCSSNFASLATVGADFK